MEKEKESKEQKKNENLESENFKVNQRVVYPTQGVGVVTDIFDKEFNGENVKHYKIYIEVSDMNVYVPVKNASKHGIRSLVGGEEAQEALELLSVDCGPVTSDWKLRFQQNMDLLKKGSIQDIAVIVRSLYQRSKVKELPIQERKLYDSAKRLLIDEVSFATGRDMADVEAELHAKLEPIGANLGKKNVQQNFDDDDDDDYDTSETEGTEDSGDDADSDDESESDDDDDESDDDDDE